MFIDWIYKKLVQMRNKKQQEVIKKQWEVAMFEKKLADIKRKG